MKLKNIITYLIILTMLFSTIPVVGIAADTDVSVEEGLLNALQITEAQGEIITRADFAEIIVKAMNMDGSVNSSDKLSFIDVDKSHAKYNYIATAKMLGLMNGYNDSIFSPDKPITAGEAIGVVVWSLGDMRIKNGMSIYDAARDNKLLKNMKGATGLPLEYDQMVILIYNYLHARVLDDIVLPYRGDKPGKGETVLEKFFGIKIYEGIVYADDYTAINGTPADEGYVRVGDRTFLDEQRVACDMLGNYIRCYYMDKDSSSLVYAYSDSKRNNVEILPLGETKNISGELKYNKETYKYDARTTFIYNSEIVTDPAVLEQAFAGNGTIKLVNSDYDSIYEAIIIEKYTIGEIEGINALSEYIKLKNVDKISYNEYRTVVFNKSDGSLLMPEELIAGNVVCIAVPVTKNGAVKVILCESEGSAVISSLDSGENTVITSEEVEYKALFDISSLVLGEEYELYLDNAGNLVYVVKAVGTRRFGYVVDASAERRSVGLEIKILDNSNEIKIFEQKDKIKVRLADGTFKKLKGKEVYDELLSANGGYIRQPVLYTLNHENLLREIWIVSSDLSVEFHTLDSLLLDLSEAERGALNYRKGARNMGGKYQMNAETVLYRVPRYNMEIKSEERDLQVANAYAYLVSGASYDSRSIRKYNDSVDGTNIVTGIAFEENNISTDVIIFEEFMEEVTEFGGSSQQPMVVTDIRYALDGEDEVYIKVTGYTAGGVSISFNYYDEDNSGFVGIVNAKRASLLQVANAVYAPISLGDIIKHNPTKVRANKNQIELYYRNDLNNDGISDPISYSNLMQHQTTSSTYRFYDYGRVTPAIVKAKHGDVVRVEVCDLRNTGLDSGIIETRDEVYNVGAIPIYIYSKSEQTIKQMTSDVISTGDTFLLVSNGGTTQFAVYYE